MSLSKACTHILDQLTDLVNQIHQDDFIKPCETLSGSTIGQHLRHTLEFFVCFQSGYQSGTINYDKRAHDKQIETDRLTALASLQGIARFIERLEVNQNLLLEVGYDLRAEEVVTVETNAYRELIYNIEHAVHHMAIMKIGIREAASYLILPPDFGIAASTIRFQETAISAHR